MLTSPEKMRELAGKYGTPLYLLDAARIVRALDGLRDGLAKVYPNSEVTYSVKTNYLAGILRRVLAAGYRLEVVSRHELELARRQGAGAGQLLFNGPVKSGEDLRFCYEQGIAVNVDSIEELTTAAGIGSPEKPFRLGVRVSVKLKNGATSRFGIDFEDAAAVDGVRQVMALGTVKVVGLHLHHSSRRDAQSYTERLDRLDEVARQLGIEAEYLDLGGGIGSVPPPEVAAKLTYEIDSHEDLARVIGEHARAKWGSKGPRIILEPGIGVLAGSMNYLTTLVAVKQRGAERIAVCDGSMFDVNPLRSTIHPPCRVMGTGRILGPAPEAGAEVKLYGGTCMEIDVVGTIAAENPQAGDLVVVSNVGAYSACLAPEFIVPPAPVYSLGEEQLVRGRPEVGEWRGAGS